MNQKTHPAILLLFLVAVTLALLVVKTLYTTESLHTERIEPMPASDAAFRDGLYLGRLQARQGREPHPTAGRWGAPDQRDSFLRGYSRGYDGAMEEFADRNSTGETQSPAD